MTRRMPSRSQSFEEALWPQKVRALCCRGAGVGENADTIHHSVHFAKGACPLADGDGLEVDGDEICGTWYGLLQRSNGRGDLMARRDSRAITADPINPCPPVTRMRIPDCLF